MSNIDAKLNIKMNVRIGIRNRKTNIITTEIFASNRVTNFMLAGMSNLLYGDTDILSKYVPAYVAVGDNLLADTQGTNVSRYNVEVSDSKLFGEIPLNETGHNERIGISSKTINNNNSDYISVSMQSYIQSGTFTDKTIREIGLFTKQSGNNCLARVILDEGIVKGADDIVDILWVITITSVVPD